MSFFSDLNKELHHMATAAAQGWQHFWQNAGYALTHFHLPAEQKQLSQSIEWGVLSCELVDDADAMQLKMEIPGVEKDDLHLEISGSLLKISGEKQYRRESHSGQFLLQERAFGSFSRQFQLPQEVEAQSISAQYTNGVLTVDMPKRTVAEQNKIKIKVS